MKRIIKISALFCAAALTLVSCQKELETAQFSDTAVTLASFGPNPAMRGGTVSFYGSNLDKITEVNVPGMDPITGEAIEVVKSGKVSQIRVVLDKEQPVIGYVTLKSSDGKEFKTKTELSYKEPIVFDGFEAKATNYPGETIILKGTYMDLVKAVVFEGGEEVEVLEGATRHEAKVVIPATAVTGKIILSDKAEIESLFYSEKDLVIGDPTVKANAKAAVKAGATITITGEHLEMIQKVTFEGAEVTELAVAEDHKSIKIVLPAEAKDGVYKAISFAGKSFTAGEITAVAPVITKVAPAPVKAGATLTITGTNLDLVTGVSMPGDAEAVFTATEKEIKVSVSAKTTEGDVTLKTANETEVKAAFTLVHPTITSVAPATLYAGDEPVVVKGTDLDLVASATIGGKAVEISAKSETELTLATAVTSVSGKVALTLANGEVIESTDAVTMQYHSKVIVTSRPASQHIGQTVTLKGTNMDLVENVFIGDAKVTKYSMRSAEELSFLMPWNKVGSYPVKFNLFDGDVETLAEEIEVLLEQEITVAFEGSAVVNWNNAVTIPNSSLAKGMSMIVEYEIYKADYHMIRVINSSWGFNPDGNATYNKSFDADGVWEIPVTAELMTNLAGQDLAFSGFGCNITKVTLIRDISQEVTLWEGEAVADNWANQPNLLSDAGLELAAANAQVGQQVRFYLTPLESAWKLQIVEGHWKGITYCSYCSVGNDTEDGKFTEVDLDAAGGFIAITITQDMLDLAYKQEWWGGTFIGNGDNVKITRIALL